MVLDAVLPHLRQRERADFMAVSLRQARGRPFADLYDPRQLVERCCAAR